MIEVKKIKISDGITQYILNDSDIKNEINSLFEMENEQKINQKEVWLIDGKQRQRKPSNWNIPTKK